MSNLLITCHVEPLQKKTDISYLDKFFLDIGLTEIPMVLLLMHGERAGENILSRYCHHCEFGLHVHGDLKEALKSYKKYFRRYPKDISFCHWEYSADNLKTVSKYGVKNDYTFSAYKNGEKYFFKPPFIVYGIKESPVSCDPILPLSPVTSWKDFLLVFFLAPIAMFKKDAFFHLSFHSYDLYSSKQAEIRWAVLVIFLKYAFRI